MRRVWLLLLVSLGLAGADRGRFPPRIDAVYHGLWQNPASDEYGQVFMQIIDDDDATPRPWSVVRGGLILRPAGGGDDTYLGLDGVYTTETGAMLLFANVPDWASQPDVVKITGANSTATEAVVRGRGADDALRRHSGGADSTSLSGLRFADVTSIETCQVAMRFRAFPVVRSSQLSFDPVTFESIWRQGSSSMDRITISGAMHSANCGFNITTAMATARSPVFLDRASRFSLMASASAIAQMLVTLKQIQSAHLGRVSLVTVSVLSLLDAYLVGSKP